MAENVGSNNGLYFIVGALIVIVGVLAFVLFGGRLGGGGRTGVDVTITAPPAPGPAPAPSAPAPTR